jgi:hypothetical protein
MFNKKKLDFGEMPYEHVPKGLKLQKLPLPSKLNKDHKRKDEETSDYEDNKTKEKNCAKQEY